MLQKSIHKAQHLIRVKQAVICAASGRPAEKVMEEKSESRWGVVSIHELSREHFNYCFK